MRVAAITGTPSGRTAGAPRPGGCRRHRDGGSRDRGPLCTEFKGWVAGQQSDRLSYQAVGRVLDAGQSETVRSGDRGVVMPQYGCGVCGYCVRGKHIYCRRQRDVLAGEVKYSSGTAIELLQHDSSRPNPVPSRGCGRPVVGSSARVWGTPTASTSLPSDGSW
jgi:hypothetical protein